MASNLTEDEAALYDRQLRLWGVEAQQRMKSSTVLFVNLRGLATESLKNVVLAGVGSVMINDWNVVQPEDLGAGFFFSVEDIGRNKAEAAIDRIRDLNPLVDVKILTERLDPMDSKFQQMIEEIDLLCITDMNQNFEIAANQECRRKKKKFYCASTYGLLGYIFSDLGDHTSMEKDRKDDSKMVRVERHYPSLNDALLYSWKTFGRKALKTLNAALVFTLFALMQRRSGQNSVPETAEKTEELISDLSRKLMVSREVQIEFLNPKTLRHSSHICRTVNVEFAPVCAILGGFLAQDIIKTLQQKDAPFSNFLAFDGYSGSATVACLGVI